MPTPRNPAEVMVVVPVWPAEKTFAESTEEKKLLDVAFENMSEEGREMVGFPAMPSPFDMAIWLAVPVIVRADIPEAPFDERMPESAWNETGPDAMRDVVVAVPKYPVPDTVRAVVEA